MSINEKIFSSNQEKEVCKTSLNKFFNQNLDKEFIYEIIFEDKNMRHIGSQLIRLYSLFLSIRTLKYLPPSYSNHVGQVYNKNNNWYFSEITPKQNHQVDNFTDFLLQKVKSDNFYGKIYIRLRDVKPKNWNPIQNLIKYSMLTAILSGISGLILGVITYNFFLDPLEIYEKPKKSLLKLRFNKVPVLYFIKFILLIPIMLVKILIVFIGIMSAKISKLLIRRNQICSSMVDIYTGTMLDIIRSCSRVPTPQDWLLYGGIIRYNAEICISRDYVQGQNVFMKKFFKMNDGHAFVVKVEKNKNIKIKKILNSTLIKYLTRGGKYPY
jgi:hypothetical protein